MAEAQEKENPFDVLAKVMEPAKNYEEARKAVWTAMKTGVLPEDMVLSILLTASTMPALAAANIQMEHLLKENGLWKDAPEEPEEELPPVNSNTLQFPKNGQVVN